MYASKVDVHLFVDILFTTDSGCGEIRFFVDHYPHNI